MSMANMKLFNNQLKLRLAQLSLANYSDKTKWKQLSVLEQRVVMSNDLAQHQTAQRCMELISLVSNG